MVAATNSTSATTTTASTKLEDKGPLRFKPRGNAVVVAVRQEGGRTVESREVVAEKPDESLSLSA